jgi:hypothetical protein
LIKDFKKRLLEYISEIERNGFADADMSVILPKLRALALDSMESEDSDNRRMAESLMAAYKKSMSPNRINKFHPGVSKFTIDRISPQLQIELSKRILANADLIKINRSQAIDRTLQRFAGWATSIPPTGSKAELKSEIAMEVTKSIRQLKYETRRREIDQGHKLMSAIDAVIGEQTNAIAVRWHSHWRQAGYDYRPDHKERDEKIYAIRGSWASKQGLINKGDGYSDEITAPGQEVFCRCNGIYLVSLGQLPDDMLTAKGKAMLEKSNREYA